LEPSPTSAGQFEGPVLAGERAGISYQAEALIGSRARAGQGEDLVAQDMAGFGDGWSHDAQLFWPASGVGSRLELMVPVLTEARYAVDLYLTRAPDYGTLAFDVGGEAMPVFYDGYAAQVEPGGPLRIGILALPLGETTIGLTVTGRNAASSGFLAGIDRVVLVIVKAAP
jgi:hypothetical protein